MLYPIRLLTEIKNKVWGQELWQVSNYPKTRLVIENGPLSGLTLQDVMKEKKLELLGNGKNRFPLILKVIETFDNLSLQVHPDNYYARLHCHGERGKNEMWYILEAEPNAKIVHGLKQGVSSYEFSKALCHGDFERMLNYVDVKKGDIVNIPAGLVHACSSGIKLLEVQQCSDVTYRIHDFGRKRKLNIKAALEVMAIFEQNVKFPEVFKMETINLSKQTPYIYMPKLCRSKSLYTLTISKGEGDLIYDGGSLSLTPHNSIVIPAHCCAFEIHGDIELVQTSVT